MPSRISGACTPCRSKKQKCSGHHPRCTQCANSSIECTWPEQRKRGPAKGYIEALESRLHSAESLLLAMLPLVNDNVIQTASVTLQQNDDDTTRGIGGRRSSPPLLNKKTGQDYWDAFPIDTHRNIRRWQYDCEAQSDRTTHIQHHNLSSNNANTQRISQDLTATTLQYRSATHSPASVGMHSPHHSPPGMPQQQHQQHQHQQQHATFMQPMQHYPLQHQHQQHQHQLHTGAAHQLVSMSTQAHDQWLASQSSDPMQMDPQIMQSRMMPSHSNHEYVVNTTQSELFW